MKLVGQRNQCQGCKEYFNSNSAFEMHRTGKFGVDRRCLTPQEMTDKGMLKNAAGFWITEARQFKGEDDASNETNESQEG